jgi:hypothetical protein
VFVAQNTRSKKGERLSQSEVRRSIDYSLCTNCSRLLLFYHNDDVVAEGSVLSRAGRESSTAP